MDISTMNRTGKRSWGLALFGLPFAGAGLAVLWFLALSPLLEWHGMRDWTPVEAQLLEAQLLTHTDSDGSDTYRATARYRYRYDGNDYSNDRVAVQGGADNIGDFQQTLGATLEQALARSQSITVFVNPAAPQQAVINRELRTGFMAMAGVFGLIFAGVGVGLIVFALRTRSGDTGVVDAVAPWRERTEWNSPEIRSRAGAGLVFIWIFTLIWCGMTAVATVAAFQEIVGKGNQAAWLVLLFDLAGVGLLAWAIHATISARKFGELVLRLDPHPGSIGGDVGGMIDLPVTHDPALTVAMTLSCTRIYTRRSGKNSETARDAVWSDSRQFFTEVAADGSSRLHFCFPVPSGLPVSGVPSSDYHEWKLDISCELPGVDLTRAFEIPVFATATKTRVASRVRESQTESLAHLETLMNLEQISDGIALDFHAGRHWRGGLGVMLFGALFAGVPVFMWYVADAGMVLTLLFGGIFGLIGLVCIGAGLWMAGNRLRVEIDRVEVRIHRALFGIPVQQRAFPRDSLLGIVGSRNGSVTSGNQVTVYYDLSLKSADGTTLQIGDGFRGYGEATRAAGVIGTYTGLPFLGEQDRATAFAARKKAFLEQRKH